MTYHILFNPHAGNERGAAEARKLDQLLSGNELHYHDMTEITDYPALFESIAPEDAIVLCGGDGTLNRFVNDAGDTLPACAILYFATGSGNDFLHDIGGTKGDAPVDIKKYLVNLPTVTVNGKTSRFINGIGYGINGYCCEVGDKQRAEGNQKINYTAIAIKGLLFHYHPVNAKVTVDGKTFDYKKVWLAPTMHGRFYGGGMMCAPAQDRLSETYENSVVLMFGSGKLKTLAVFPSIFKGEHVKHTEMVAVHTGHEVTVTFDKPTALQIDGETILGVTSYSASAYSPKNDTKAEELAGVGAN